MGRCCDGTISTSRWSTPRDTLAGQCVSASARTCSPATRCSIAEFGRCDLPGGSWPALIFSIEHRIYTLPPDTVVYPGHGQKTVVEEEMRHNPFVVHPRYR